MTKTIKYFNETTQQWERVGGGATGDLSGKVDGSLRLTASSTAPATPAVGDLWVDIDEASDIFGTNGQVFKEVPTGAKNGSNTTFTTSRGYIPNTLQVYVNGIAQSRMVTESNPSAGIFSIDALQPTDDLVASYQFSNTVAGNADTLDGFHADSTPTANQILPLDSDSKFPFDILKSATVNSYTNTGTGGGIFYYTTLFGIKILWGCTGVVPVNANSAVTGTISIPAGFFDTVTAASMTSSALSANVGQYVAVSSTIPLPSPSGIQYWANNTGGANGSQRISMILIGN